MKDRDSEVIFEKYQTLSEKGVVDTVKGWVQGGLKTADRALGHQQTAVPTPGQVNPQQPAATTDPVALLDQAAADPNKTAAIMKVIAAMDPAWKKTFAENPQIAPIIGVAAAGAAPAKPVMTGTPAAAAAAPVPA